MKYFELGTSNCCCLGSSCLFGWVFEEALELTTILRRSEAGIFCEIWPPWMLEKHQVICKNLPTNPARKRGCWSLEEHLSTVCPILLITLWFLSRVLCCKIKITSQSQWIPCYTQHEKFIPNRKTSIIRVLHQAHQPACWIIFQRSLPIKLFAGSCWGAWNVCGEEPWVWILDGLKHMFFQRKRQGFLGMVTKSCAWFIWFILPKVYPQSGAVRRSDVFGVFLSHGIYCGYQLDVLLRHAWHLSCICTIIEVICINIAWIASIHYLTFVICIYIYYIYICRLHQSNYVKP